MSRTTAIVEFDAECPRCAGEGSYATDYDPSTGLYDGEDCGQCEGTGIVRDTEAVEVPVNVIEAGRDFLAAAFHGLIERPAA